MRTLFPVALLVVQLVPAALRAQETAYARDSAYMAQKVLPPGYPSYLFSFVGDWTLTLTRPHHRDLSIPLSLAPDSVSRIFAVLDMDHEPCMACLGADLTAPWIDFLQLPPPSTRFTLVTNGQTLWAAIPGCVYTPCRGDVRLEGTWEADSAFGTWSQRDSPDSARGAFTMRRPRGGGQ